MQVMTGGLSRGSRPIFLSRSLHKFDDTAHKALSISYSSQPHFVASFDKKQMGSIRHSQYLCPEDTFDRYDAVSPFLPASSIP